MIAPTFHCRLLARAVTVLLMMAALLIPAVPLAQAAGGQTFFSLAASRQLADSYSPSQVATAYGLTPLLQGGIDGTGETVGIVALDAFSLADIRAFDRQFNLPDPAIQEFYPAGETFRLDHAGESTLDLEWAHAMAPGAQLQVYYLNPNQSDAAGWKQLAQQVNAATANHVTTLGLGFGACRVTKAYTAAEQAFAHALVSGVNIFVSSGDTGDLPGPARDCGKKIGVAYPASDPSVVAVGGTSLQLGANGSIAGESAWSESGGGKGRPLLRPIWQITPNLNPGKYRYVPDVAFIGDPETGVAMYFNGEWQQVGGTSVGAPAWAGIWAVIAQDARQASTTLPPAPSLIYQIGNSTAYGTAFHDVTTGSNGRYRAETGWDPVTGWGTPDIAGLATAALALGTKS